MSWAIHLISGIDTGVPGSQAFDLSLTLNHFVEPCPCG